MEEEWIRWMRENAPERLYLEMEGSLTWAAKWRDNLISNYTKALTDYINETGVASTLLPDVVPPTVGTMLDRISDLEAALRDELLAIEEQQPPTEMEEERAVNIRALLKPPHDKDHDVAEHVYDDNQCQPSDPDEQTSRKR